MRGKPVKTQAHMSTEDEAVVEAIKSLFGDFILKHTWTSGSSTEAPSFLFDMSYRQKELRVHLSPHDRRHFPQSEINRFVKGFAGVLKTGRYVKEDGSCPDYLLFCFENLKN